MKTMRLVHAAACATLLACSPALGAELEAVNETAPSLYDRLGAWDGIHRIVSDTVALHESNPAIRHYFRSIDRKRLIASVTAFFAAGSGGPDCYKGRDMTTAHAHMGLTPADFDAAVSDVMNALAQNAVGQREQDEVRAILLSLKDPVLGTATAAQ